MNLDAVRVALMERFAALMRAPTNEELALAAGLDVAEVPAALEALQDERMLVLRDGELWMAAPFSAVPTAYVAVVNGRRHFGNCIWDALGIFAMLGQDGRLDTSCGCCGTAMQLRLAGGRLDPTAGIAHFGIPAAHWWDDIVFN